MEGFDKSGGGTAASGRRQQAGVGDTGLRTWGAIRQKIRNSGVFWDVGLGKWKKPGPTRRPLSQAIKFKFKKIKNKNKKKRQAADCGGSLGHSIEQVPGGEHNFLLQVLDY